MNIPEITGANSELYTNFVFYKKGGMGDIYRGIEKTSKQVIILKLVVIQDPSDEKLLMREIDVSTKFSSPNVVTAKSVGKIKIDGNDYLYMILDFFENGNMRNLIKVNTPIQKCYSMMLDILNGMKDVHSLIVHRDLKPENILVDSDEKLYITDFGLAKYISEKTKTKSFKGSGTLPYMAPECWTGDDNTVSMDIYALGLIFFEIITGKMAYKASSEIEWRNCHLFSPLPDISKSRNIANIKLKQIIQKMTNKRSYDRYTNIEEVIVSLKEAILLDEIKRQDADQLALMGNMAIQQKKSKALARAKELEIIDELKNSLKFNIEELFSKFTDIANATNNRLEEEKIKISKNTTGNNTENISLKFNFNGKGLKITFNRYDSVINNENALQESSRNNQKKEYGFVMTNPPKPFFTKNNIVLVGLAETIHKIGNSEYGFNLLLKKQPNSHYGEWYIMQFTKNITPPETSFGINLNTYFNDYSKFQFHSYFTVTNRLIDDNDIIALIEKIML